MSSKSQEGQSSILDYVRWDRPNNQVFSDGHGILKVLLMALRPSDGPSARPSVRPSVRPFIRLLDYRTSSSMAASPPLVAAVAVASPPLLAPSK